MRRDRDDVPRRWLFPLAWEPIAPDRKRVSRDIRLFFWTLQMLLGVYFLGMGIVLFIVPPGLPAAMSWMDELCTALHWFAATANILGGLGLILLSLPGIRPRLTLFAVGGLALLTLGEVVYHLQRSEAGNMVIAMILASLLMVIAHQRWRQLSIQDERSERRS